MFEPKAAGSIDLLFMYFCKGLTLKNLYERFVFLTDLMFSLVIKFNLTSLFIILIMNLSFEDMMQNYANLKDAALHGATVVNEARPYLASQNPKEIVEINARLGVWTANSFDSNIGTDMFCAILHLMDSYSRWSHTKDWAESQDVFYTLSLPSTGGDNQRVQVRTSVSSDNGQHTVCHVVKKRIKDVDFELQSMDHGSCALGTDTRSLVHDVSAKITSSLKKHLPADILPVAVTPDVVRIKRQKRFFLTSLGIEGDCFVFDCTITYSGRSKSEAEQNQKHNQNPTFEIEIECLASEAYLNLCSNEGTCLSLSLLLKLHDFVAHLNQGMHVTFVPRGVNNVGHVPVKNLSRGPGIGSAYNTIFT